VHLGAPHLIRFCQKGIVPMNRHTLLTSVITLAFIVSSCGSLGTSVPTPGSTETPIPLLQAEPALHSEVVSFCQDVLNSEKGNNANNTIPSHTIRPKTILNVKIIRDSETRESDILFPYLEATNTQDISFVLCIDEIGHYVEYTNGSRLWAGTWNVRLVSWPDGKGIASQSFIFNPPAVLGSGEGFAPSLQELCFRWLLTGVDDSTLKTYPGFLISISPDFSRMLLWLDDVNGYELWDVKTDTKIGAFTKDTNFLKVSPDWTTFAQIAADRLSVRIFNMQTMQEMYSLNSEALLAYDYSVDGKTLATLDSDFIVIWDISNGQQLKTVNISNQSGMMLSDARSLLFRDAQSPIIIRQGLGSVLLDVNSEEARMLGSEIQAITPDGKRLVYFNFGSGFIQSLPFGDGQDIYNNHRPVTALAFAPDGKSLAVGDTDGQIILLGTDDWRVKMTMEKIHLGNVTQLFFSKDGNELVSVSSGTIKFWSLEKQP
jgi:WD40 repeat protein